MSTRQSSSSDSEGPSDFQPQSQDKKPEEKTPTKELSKHFERLTLSASEATESGPSTRVFQDRSPKGGTLPGAPCKQKPHSPKKSGHPGNTPSRQPRTPEATASPPTTRGSPGSAKKPRPATTYYYALELPFKCSPNYRMIIKVGNSDNPGRRLYNISNGLDKQTTRMDFKCNLGISQYDSAAETIRKAKGCDKFLFVVACRNSEEQLDITLGENSIRGIVGQPIVDDFIRRYLDNIPDPTIIKKDCGPTEWVTCTATTARQVREAFQSGVLDGNSGGDDRRWDSWVSLVEKLKQILGPTTIDVTFGCGDRTRQEHITI